MPIFPLPGNVVTGGILQATDVSGLYAAINGLLDFQNIATGGLTGNNFAANTVPIGKIKSAATSFGITQTVANHFNGAYFVMPSGAYSFFPGLSTDSDAATRGSIGGDVTADGVAEFDKAKVLGISYVLSNVTPRAIVWLAVLNPANTGTNIAVLTANYIQTSPPYDLGDGPIPLFMFAAVDSGGVPRLAWIGPDPPWAKEYKPKLKLPYTLAEVAGDPIKMKAVTDVLSTHIVTSGAVADLAAKRMTAVDPETAKVMDSQIAGLVSQIVNLTPETQTQKNEDMATTPHPFINNDLGAMGLTVVMLNPFNETAKMLAFLHENGENVASLVLSGALSVGATQIVPAAPAPVGTMRSLDSVSGAPTVTSLNLKGPPGVAIVEHGFK
jgi:hypothetical protein